MLPLLLLPSDWLECTCDDRSWEQSRMKAPIAALEHLSPEISMIVINFFLLEATEFWSLCLRAVYTITELL